MKINFGHRNAGQSEEPDYLKNYIYEDYEPVKSSYSNMSGYSKKKKNDFKWVMQLLVSAFILIIIVGLFRYNLPFTGPLREAVRYLMNTDADVEPVFHKIVQLAAQSGNVEWPLVDDVPGQGAKAASKTPSSAVKKDEPAGNSLQVILPVSGKVVSQYGWTPKTKDEIQEFNEGIDIEVPLGTDVKASVGGQVIKIGENDIQGKYVLIKMPSGMMMRYSNLSEIVIGEGKKVEMGEVIAKSGMNLENKPNLHFEVIVDGKPVNPLEQLGLDSAGSTVTED